MTQKKRKLRKGFVAFATIFCLAIIGGLAYAAVQIFRAGGNAQAYSTDQLPWTDTTWQAVSTGDPAAAAAAITSITRETIVNSSNLMAANAVPDNLVNIADLRPPNIVGVKSVDMLANREALEALFEMLAAARDEGLTGFTILSAYRPYERQRELLDEAINNNMRAGMSFAAAEADARRTIQEPGASEHQTGLAFDMAASLGNGEYAAEYNFAGTEHCRWLAENAHKYGFILRYPEGKESITGIAYECWHYRYVGKELAQRLVAEGKCLEEK